MCVSEWCWPRNSPCQFPSLCFPGSVCPPCSPHCSPLCYMHLWASSTLKEGRLHSQWFKRHLKFPHCCLSYHSLIALIASGVHFFKESIFIQRWVLCNQNLCQHVCSYFWSRLMAEARLVFCVASVLHQDVPVLWWPFSSRNYIKSANSSRPMPHLSTWINITCDLYKQLSS